MSSFESFQARHTSNCAEHNVRSELGVSIDSPEIVQLHSTWVQALTSAGILASSKDIGTVEKIRHSYHVMGKHLDNPVAIWFVDPESPEVIQARFYMYDKSDYAIFLTDTHVDGFYVSGGPNQTPEILAKIYEIGKTKFGWKL